MSILKPNETAIQSVEQIIKRRRSTRHFTNEPVSQESLLKLVEAGVYAPSGSNTQNQRFLIITEPSQISTLDSVRFVWPYKSSKYRNKQQDRLGIISNAAAAILVFSDNSLTDLPRTGEYYIWQVLNIQNCSASIENILVMATAMGLGTCWVSATETMNHTRLLSNRTWRDALKDYDIPPEFTIQGVILVGHAKTKDPEGFPAGEGMHGVDWSPTAREPVESYLIQRKRQPSCDTLPRLAILRLRILSKLVHVLLAIVRRLDKLISGTEVQAIENWRQKRNR